MTKFNLIGFNFRKSDKIEYKQCVIHPGSRLIQSTEDPTLLLCTECGTPYLEKDTATEEQIHSMFGPSSNKSKIVQPRKQKKFFDQSGNEINDPDLIQDILQGKTVISYHEQTFGETKTIVKRNSRHS